MKPQTFESTPISAKGRSHGSVTLLAGLLVLAAILIGGVFLFSQRPPAAASDTRSAGAHELIANCRVCRDEALGSAVTNLSATDSSFTMLAPAELFRRNGPR